ncbi:MAG: type II secretion system minor pseudopilin GspK [Sphingomonas sp.]
MHRNRDAETGAALLTVLLIVAVVSIVAANALEKMRLANRLGSNAIALEQARGYAMAAETLATTRIDGLLKRDGARVTLAGGWSGTPFPLPVPDAIATAMVVDGGNCFNLNSLVTETQPGVYVMRPASVTQFARLMRLVGVPGQEAVGIAAAAADWIDSDSDVQPQGAEDASYGRGATAYRTANTLMADVSELRSVAGVSPLIYRQLSRWLCTQPRAAVSRLNVNTLLPEQAPLLAMLFPDTLDVARARQLLVERPAQGFASTNEFFQRPALQGLAAGPEIGEQTAITTQWFSLTVSVTLGNAVLNQQALIDARARPAQVVSRGWDDPA